MTYLRDELCADKGDWFSEEDAKKITRHLGPKLDKWRGKGIKTCKWCFGVFPVEEEHHCPIKRQITDFYE